MFDFAHNFAHSKVLGLDICSSSVKMVELSKDRAGYTVDSAAILDIPDVTEKSSQEEQTLQAIQESLKSFDSQADSVVCGVCGPEVAVRNFKFPPLQRNEVENAVMLEASQICPFDVTHSTVDYQLLPDKESNVSGILVAAKNSWIDKKRQIAEGLSFHNILVDVDGLALINCFNELEKTETGQSTAIFNVGSSFVNLAFIGNCSPPFIRDMVYAGDDIIKVVANEAGETPENIKKILFGEAESKKPETELTESLKKGCKKLIVDIKETLRYHRTHTKSAAVEKIFVCGGFALVKGFIEILNDQLSAEVILWNPFEKISLGENSLKEKTLREKGPTLAVAAGLAMRTI